MLSTIGTFILQRTPWVVVAFAAIAGAVYGAWLLYNTIDRYMDEHDTAIRQNQELTLALTELEKSFNFQKVKCSVDMDTLRESLSRKLEQQASLEKKLTELEEAENNGYPTVVQPSVAAGLVSKEDAKCEIPPAILFTFDRLRNS